MLADESVFVKGIFVEYEEFFRKEWGGTPHFFFFFLLLSNEGSDLISNCSFQSF